MTFGMSTKIVRQSRCFGTVKRSFFNRLRVDVGSSTECIEEGASSEMAKTVVSAKDTTYIHECLVEDTDDLTCNFSFQRWLLRYV